MAVKSLNSVGGFSIKDSITDDPLVIVDENGNVNTPTLTVTGNTDLGSVSNVTITGGSPNYVLKTDGTGNLSWTAQSNGGGAGNSISNMPSYISSGDSYTLNANFQGLFAEPIVVDGTLEIFGDLIDVSGNNYITGNGTLTISTFSATGNITGSYIFGNGYYLTGISGGGGGTPGGSTTQLQYNNAGAFGGISTATFSGGKLTLGSNSQVKITGGTSGYVLQTDGAGNLSWVAQSGGGGGGANIANGTSNVNIPTSSGNVNTSVNGTANVLVVTGTGANVVGTISSSGNIQGANLVTGGVVSATGNANVGNIGTALITATGNITGANLVTGGVLSVTGNANIGNIGTGGLITATGNITGGNLVTGGVISATGNGTFANVNGGNLITANFVAGVLTTAAQPNITSLGVLSSITATGNITGGNLVGPHASGNSNISITANSNIAMTVSGNANIIVVTGTGANIIGTLSVSGNLTSGNITDTRIVTRTNNNGATTSGTITPNADTSDQYNLIGLTGTVTIASPSGTFADGQKLTLRIKDNGTSRTLNWTTGSANSYRVIGVALPTSTTAGKVSYVGCVYNSQDVFWDVVAASTQV